MRRSSAGWALVSLSLVLCPLAGCLGSRCSSGQVLREGLCVPVLDGRTEGGTGELGATDAAAGERAAYRGPDARATGAGGVPGPLLPGDAGAGGGLLHDPRLHARPGQLPLGLHVHRRRALLPRRTEDLRQDLVR